MFLVKKDGAVHIYYNESALEAAGIGQADLEITEQEWLAKGGFARVLNGEIVVGDTDEELALYAKQNALDAIDYELIELGKKQERSSAEITAAIIQNQPVPEESKKFHLKRQARIEELRQERKQYAD